MSALLSWCSLERRCLAALFPLTLTLCLRERTPRTMCAPCTLEPTHGPPPPPPPPPPGGGGAGGGGGGGGWGGSPTFLLRTGGLNPPLLLFLLLLPLRSTRG